MVAERERRCHPLQVASPEPEGIMVWGCGVAMVTCWLPECGMPVGLRGGFYLSEMEWYLRD